MLYIAQMTVEQLQISNISRTTIDLRGPRIRDGPVAGNCCSDSKSAGDFQDAVSTPSTKPSSSSFGGAHESPFWCHSVQDETNNNIISVSY